MSTAKSLQSIVFAIVAGLAISGCSAVPATQGEDSTTRFVMGESATGSSAAVVVSGGALAHTGLLLPVDRAGTVQGATTADQIDRLLEKVDMALAPAGADRDDLVKINITASTDEAVREARTHFAQVFSGDHKPAISYVVGRFGDPAVRVGADVVATTTVSAGGLRVYHAEALGGSEEIGHVAVVPLTDLLYVSGQGVRGEDLISMMHESMMAGLARMSWLGLSAEDIVQVKVFQRDLSRAEEVENELHRYFRAKPSPPIVFAQWDRPDGIEIELIAAKPTRAETDDAVTMLWSPDAPQIPQYSRLAEINYGDIVYLSTIEGDPSKDADGQLEDVYNRMGEVLNEVGSDFDHLLKATYYITDWQAPRLGLNEIREDYYKSGRPPTSSLILVESVGCDGCLVAIDMIGVVPADGARR